MLRNNTCPQTLHTFQDVLCGDSVGDRANDNLCSRRQGRGQRHGQLVVRLVVLKGCVRCRAKARGVLHEVLGLEIHSHARLHDSNTQHLEGVAVQRHHRHRLGGVVAVGAVQSDLQLRARHIDQKPQVKRLHGRGLEVLGVVLVLLGCGCIGASAGTASARGGFGRHE
mgnify:CR=1 FL=1